MHKVHLILFFKSDRINQQYNKLMKYKEESIRLFKHKLIDKFTNHLRTTHLKGFPST